MFRYEPLGRSRPSIRLLDILPQTSNTIKCEIKHYAIPKTSEELSYAALSYEWGSDESLSHTIELNGHQLYVRDNLFHFLKCLLLQYPSQGFRHLWVDALSINQADMEERNHQVQQMKEIYSSASEVLLWLGPAADGSDELFEFLNQLKLPPYDPSKPVFEGTNVLQEEDKPLVEKMRRHNTLWEPYKAMSWRSYWSRLWIVQEVLLARNARMLCGHHEIPWIAWTLCETVFTDEGWFPKWENKGPRFVARSEVVTSGSWRVIGEWRRRSHGGSSALIDMVREFSFTKCSNPLDRLYGMLGLTSSETQVPVDYGGSVLDLVILALGLVASPETRRAASRSPYISTPIIELCNAFKIAPARLLQQIDSKSLHLTSSTQRDVHGSLYLAKPSPGQTEADTGAQPMPQSTWAQLPYHVTYPEVSILSNDVSNLFRQHVMDTPLTLEPVSKLLPVDVGREKDLRKCNCLRCHSYCKIWRTRIPFDDQVYFASTDGVWLFFQRSLLSPADDVYVATGTQAEQVGHRAYSVNDAWILLFYDPYMEGASSSFFYGTRRR